MLIRQNILFLLTALAFSVCLQSTLAGEADTGDLLRGGGIVFSQLPTHTGGPASDTEFVNSSGMSSWQLEADQVQVANEEVIRQVKWLGFYGSSMGPHEEPPLSEAFRIRFYSVRIGDGLPDDILFEQSTNNGHRNATGATVQSVELFNEYSYYLDLTSPFTLSANTLYWLEIVQVGSADSLFRWENGIATMSGHALLNPFIPDWELSSGSFAFQLSTVPEPTMLGILLLGLTGFKPRRKRR